MKPRIKLDWIVGAHSIYKESKKGTAEGAREETVKRSDVKSSKGWMPQWWVKKKRKKYIQLKGTEQNNRGIGNFTDGKICGKIKVKNFYIPLMSFRFFPFFFGFIFVHGFVGNIGPHTIAIFDVVGKKSG